MKRGSKNRISPDDDGQMNLQPVIPIDDFEMLARSWIIPRAWSFFGM